MRRPRDQVLESGLMVKTKRASVPEPAQDPRELPAYGLTEAARYLRMPEATLRILGGGAVLSDDGWSALLQAGDPSPRHWLARSCRSSTWSRRMSSTPSGGRRTSPCIRFAPRSTSSNGSYHSRHPLVEHQFETDGLDLFIQKAGLLINLSQEGQLAMREVVASYLRRVERDVKGLPIRLYPFTRKREPDEPRVVVIDPLSRSAGRCWPARVS